jgi:alginate O-acetyltransferase complex protein AlgI
MLFTTLTFAIFLVVFLILYWTFDTVRVQNILIVIGGYFFYGWWDWRFCSLMLITTFLDYSVALGMGKTNKPQWRRLFLGASLIGNIGLLAFFKYFNFFAENFTVLANSVGWHVEPITLHIILPIGLSFYTFQELSYTFDVYRGKIKPTSNLVEFMAFVAFFPQLVAGPIERAHHMLPQYEHKRVFSYPMAVSGARQMLWGFFKKLVVADNLANYVQLMYADPPAHNGFELALATFCFAFQIYCDFSAYSDIAIGTARLLGFELMRNFAYPYFSQTMGEFWRRWHISLSTWFRDYVYIPLGGNQVSRARRVLNLLTTFIISGLWHGASWNFIIWGGLNGVGVLPSALAGRGKQLQPSDVPGGPSLIPSLITVFRMLRTFLIIFVTWVFFRAATFGDSLIILRKIFTDFYLFDSYGGLAGATPGKRIMLILTLFILVEWISRAQPHPLNLDRFPRILRWGVYTAMLWGTLYFAAPRSGQFIYFQF